MTGSRFILLFIDGVGVGCDDPGQNPLATGAFKTLRLTHSLRPDSVAGPPAVARGLDASLGVPGLPQSATGQTSILTGVNAPAILGRHHSGFPGPTLRPILKEHSLLKRLRESGRSVSFLNAYRPAFFQIRPSERRLSATSLATAASGTPFRSWDDVLAGRALIHDITHWRMRERGHEIPHRTPEEAGAIISRESASLDFALFEYFETDRAGHAMDRNAIERSLSDLDRTIQTILSIANLETTTVAVVSDHGNVEDLSVGTHTTAPALFAAWGKGARDAPPPERITDVAPFVWRALGAEPPKLDAAMGPLPPA